MIEKCRLKVKFIQTEPCLGTPKFKEGSNLPKAVYKAFFCLQIRISFSFPLLRIVSFAFGYISENVGFEQFCLPSRYFKNQTAIGWEAHYKCQYISSAVNCCQLAVKLGSNSWMKLQTHLKQCFTCYTSDQHSFPLQDFKHKPIIKVISQEYFNNWVSSWFRKWRSWTLIGSKHKPGMLRIVHKRFIVNIFIRFQHIYPYHVQRK